MLKGNIVLEDHEIDFTEADGKVTFTVTDTFKGVDETFTVDADKFFKALAIAVHSDGMPDYDKDYPDAESIMGSIRWIP